MPWWTEREQRNWIQNGERDFQDMHQLYFYKRNMMKLWKVSQLFKCRNEFETNKQIENCVAYKQGLEVEPTNEALKQGHEQVTLKIQAAEHNVNGEEV